MVSEDDIAYAMSRVPYFQSACMSLIKFITRTMDKEGKGEDPVIAISIFKRALELILENDKLWD